MKMQIEQYSNPRPGYDPILIRDGWQIGHLNFLPGLQADALDRVERHSRTDEVFILFRGDARLIAATETAAGLAWEVQSMCPGVTYNIPAACWHNIAMSPGDTVIIVEKNDTHLHDVEYRALTAEERRRLQAALAPAAPAVSRP